MKKKRIPLGLIILLLFVLIIGIFYAYNKYYFPNAKAYAKYIETYQEYDSNEISEINIDSINHKVIIKPSEDGKVKITYFQKNDNMNMYTLENGKIRMELIENVEDLDTLLFKTEKKIDTITIYLPVENSIKVNVAASYGNLEIYDISLSTISFKNTIGNIKLKNIACTTITVDLNTGNADMEHIKFDQLSTKIVSGNINVQSEEMIEQYNLAVKAIYGTLQFNDKQLFSEEQPESVINEIEQFKSDTDKKIAIEILRGNIKLNFKENISDNENKEN
ncbi:MAG: DUF4097 family beta strand repeat-containing protein [Erysipelotrichia bacterium]|nr:DUF4097 family beta strand repeat-containing protein [Erysipelotrichia bacterium]